MREASRRWGVVMRALRLVVLVVRLVRARTTYDANREAAASRRPSPRSAPGLPVEGLVQVPRTQPLEIELHVAVAAGPGGGHDLGPTLLVIDETHTISTGPGGWPRAFGLDPDIFFPVSDEDAGPATGSVFRQKRLMLGVLAIAVLWMGVYPAPFTDAMQTSVSDLLQHVAVSKIPQ